MDHIKGMVKAGVMEPIENRHGQVWNSPPLIVKKANGQLRLVIDYREANKEFLPGTFPLPNLRDCITEMGKGKKFSALDCRKAYHAIRIHPDSRKYLGFGCLGKQWTYIGMPMGVNFAPSVFSRTMNDTVEPLDENGREFVKAYMDDIIVFSETEEQHLADLDLV